jgi:hypothetical protein
MSNIEFAHRSAEAADALTEYDHLPTLGLMTITERAVYLMPADHGHDGIVALARWAAAFNAKIQLLVSPNWEIVTSLELGGRVPVQLYVNLHRQQAHELGVRLGVALSPAGEVAVSAEQLLAALHVEPAGSIAGDLVDAVPAVTHA